ncbi:MAG: hypothetical protein HYR88_03040 [Verrucomicrobia bacterium]|nr:hypothetical protein [Verrucomicrobiota bacterium]MBI3870864.1 hypothetical protein [Verrucomicrobiota bacterium]
MPLVLACALFLAAPPSRGADAITPAVQARLDEKLKQIQEWANSATVVKAVLQRNATPLAEVATMNQDQWKAVTLLNPVLKLFTKNDVAEFLKSKKDDALTEAFVSAADGTKIAFLSKTTNWSHAGKPKHDQPMAGKNWQGNIEVDESTGAQQIQISVPVMSEGKPIGSLVVGFSVNKLSGS